MGLVLWQLSNSAQGLFHEARFPINIYCTITIGGFLRESNRDFRSSVYAGGLDVDDVQCKT